MPKKNLLDILNTTVYRDDKKVFDRFSLTIKNGESAAIIGPNGAGKSSLLKLLSREIYPVVGKNSFVKILDLELPTLWDLRKKIGFISADLQTEFVPDISGLGVIISGLYNSIGLFHHQDISDKDLERGKKILEYLGIMQLKNRRFRQMSTGQQRICLLGRALIHDPDHLILDEPTSGLDIRSSHQYLKIIRELLCDGKTILLATHHIDEIPPEIKRVILMKDGKIFGDGKKEILLKEKKMSELFNIQLRVLCSNGFYQVYPAEI
ncbi:MAG: molybdenum ABC transporter ATP-binding protein [Porticoccus sp.]|jgi:iron complex transport system ATP-binding protein|nr:molybdenum ABC transporter ATP-binding protein [Porticoccus sp.]